MKRFFDKINKTDTCWIWIAGFYSIELAQEYFDEKFKINKLINIKENKIIRYV